MSYDAHKNFAYSLVATAPSPALSGTSLVVTAATGTKFPAVPFNATVWPINAQPTTANAEVVRVTNISTDTLTITRTQESSSARSILVGDQIAATITAKSLTDIEVPLGALDLSTVTAGQIIFPAAQNPSAGANTLDDYEEGTWTPVLGGNSATSGQSYSAQVGHYIKIGKLVFASFNLVLTTKGTITGTLQLQALPFTVENLNSHAPAISIGGWSGFATGVVWLGGNAVPNTTAADIRAATAATGGTSSLTTTDINAGVQIFGHVMYRASS